MAVVINQVIIFALLMAIGFIAAKTNVFTKQSLNDLSRLIVKVILPALIFSIVAQGVTVEEFMISGRFAMGTLLCFSLLIPTGFALSKLSGLKDKTANVFVALSTFGNMGFMGIPLILEIFKEPIAQVCISVYTLVDMALLWTLGVYLCSRHEQNSNLLSALRNMINPTTIALLSAFAVMFLRISVPDLLMNTISGIGDTSKYLTLMYLGGSLAYVSVHNTIKKPSIFVLTVVKMLIMPVIVYFLLGFFLPQVPRMILTLIVGLPSMTTVVMLASSYNSDYEFATEIIFVTTLASIITLPLISTLTVWL